MTDKQGRVSKKAAVKAATKPTAPVRRLPEPPRTSFNFVSETVDGRRRRRQSVATVTSVAVVCLFLTIFLGVRAQTAASSSRAEAERIDDKIKDIKVESASAFKYEGVNIPGNIDVPGHLSKRISQVATSFAEDIDPEAVFSIIKETTPEQIRVKSVSIQSVVAEQQTVQQTTTTTSPKSDTTPSTTQVTAEPVSYTQYDFKFSVSAVVPSYADAQVWKDLLRQKTDFVFNVSLSPPAGDVASGLTVNAEFFVSRKALLTRQKSLLEPIAPEIFSTGESND
jgi:hypothetical protein